MPSANVTLTGTTGPDIDSTARVFPNISNVEFDLAKSIIRMKDSRGVVTEWDYAITATVTWVIAAGVATITIA